MKITLTAGEIMFRDVVLSPETGIDGCMLSVWMETAHPESYTYDDNVDELHIQSGEYLLWSMLQDGVVTVDDVRDSGAMGLDIVSF